MYFSERAVRIKVHKKISLSKMWSVAKCEYIKWITNPRNIVVIVLLIFIKTLFIDTLAQRADRYGSPMNVLEPFIAVGNSWVAVLLLPSVFLVLMSDFPKFDGNSLFVICRSGKLNWLYGQMLFAVMAVISYIAVVFLAVVGMSVGNTVLSSSWSEAARFYAAKFPDEMNTFATLLLPENLYNQLDPICTIVHTLVLIILYLFLLSLVLLICRISSGKMTGMFICTAVIALGVATCALRSDLMWLFPMGNSIIWMHYTEIIREPIKPIWYSYVYFAVMALLLIFMSTLRAKRLSVSLLPEES